MSNIHKLNPNSVTVPEAMTRFQKLCTKKPPPQAVVLIAVWENGGAQVNISDMSMEQVLLASGLLETIKHERLRESFGYEGYDE